MSHMYHILFSHSDLLARAPFDAPGRLHLIWTPARAVDGVIMNTDLYSGLLRGRHLCLRARSLALARARVDVPTPDAPFCGVTTDAV